jgi:hypothetical protein
MAIKCKKHCQRLFLKYFRRDSSDEKFLDEKHKDSLDVITSKKSSQSNLNSQINFVISATNDEILNNLKSKNNSQEIFINLKGIGEASLLKEISINLEEKESLKERIESLDVNSLSLLLRELQKQCAYVLDEIDENYIQILIDKFDIHNYKKINR